MRNKYGDIFVKFSFVAFKIMALAIYLFPIRWFPRWKFLLCAFLHKVVHFWLLLPMSTSSNGSSYHYKSKVEGEIVGSRPTWCMCHYNKDKGFSPPLVGSISLEFKRYCWALWNDNLMLLFEFLWICCFGRSLSFIFMSKHITKSFYICLLFIFVFELLSPSGKG